MDSPPDPAGRLRRLRDEMAVKSRYLVERSRRTDSNGNLTDEAEAEAAYASGYREAPAPPTPEIRLARLQAGDRHNLRLDQIDQMTGTTEAEIELEARALTPPGDGGPRGVAVDPGPPLDQAIREAEQAGDINASMSLKSQKLLDISAAKAQRNHPNAPR